jgi:transcription initiation factor TFIID subunit 9B
VKLYDEEIEEIEEDESSEEEEEDEEAEVVPADRASTTASGDAFMRDGTAPPVSVVHSPSDVDMRANSARPGAQEEEEEEDDGLFGGEGSGDEAMKSPTAETPQAGVKRTLEEEDDYD